jgi:hypothetical protein
MLKKMRKVQLSVLYPPRIERAVECGKIPFKSGAYLNEKHSRSSYLKRMRQKGGAANDKNRAMNGARFF